MGVGVWVCGRGCVGAPCRSSVQRQVRAGPTACMVLLRPASAAPLRPRARRACSLLSPLLPAPAQALLRAATHSSPCRRCWWCSCRSGLPTRRARRSGCVSCGDWGPRSRRLVRSAGPGSRLRSLSRPGSCESRSRGGGVSAAGRECAVGCNRSERECRRGARPVRASAWGALPAVPLTGVQGGMALAAKAPPRPAPLCQAHWQLAGRPHPPARMRTRPRACPLASERRWGFEFTGTSEQDWEEYCELTLLDAANALPVLSAHEIRVGGRGGGGGGGARRAGELLGAGQAGGRAGRTQRSAAQPLMGAEALCGWVGGVPQGVRWPREAGGRLRPGPCRALLLVRCTPAAEGAGGCGERAGRRGAGAHSAAAPAAAAGAAGAPGGRG